MTPSPKKTRLRTDAQESDIDDIRRITTATGFFSAEEVEIAAELIEDRVRNGEASDYKFVFAEMSGTLVGYASFGHIACTVGSYDLYWIVVHPDCQGAGIGRALLLEVERRIAEAGGRRIYVETSGRAQYEPTRNFYLRCGYLVDADQPDFYAPGDAKVTLVKVVDPAARR